MWFWFWRDLKLQCSNWQIIWETIISDNSCITCIVTVKTLTKILFVFISIFPCVLRLSTSSSSFLVSWVNVESQPWQTGVFPQQYFSVPSFILDRFPEWHTEITKEESINCAKNGGNKGKSVRGSTGEETACDPL